MDEETKGQGVKLACLRTHNLQFPYPGLETKIILFQSYENTVLTFNHRVFVNVPSQWCFWPSGIKSKDWKNFTKLYFTEHRTQNCSQQRPTATTNLPELHCVIISSSEKSLEKDEFWAHVWVGGEVRRVRPENSPHQP